MAKCKIRLLVEAPPIGSSDDTSIVLCGRHWVLTEYEDIGQAPPYTCISYAWGAPSARVANPIDPSHLIAQRTIPVLETVVRFAQSRENWANNVQFSHARNVADEERGQMSALDASKAIWVDALCVPAENPERIITLESMGVIFASAYQVFAVLTSACAHVLQVFRTAGQIGHSELAILEGESWLTRAWTYQETVNSQALYFVAETNERVAFSGLDFLNGVLEATDTWRETSDLSKFEWSVEHPGLETLQQLIADYRIADFQERSAYQVMCAMQPRHAERPEDYFYSMIGAVTTEPASDRTATSPAEYFRNVCEAKGDYSFIFCVAPRLNEPGKRWCPQAVKTPPVVSGLLMSGERLAGHRATDHLVLDNICRLTPEALNNEGLKAVTSFVQQSVVGLDIDALALAVLGILQKNGFTGCGDYFQVTNGFFFPQSPIETTSEIIVAVSPDLVWTGGAPGLVVRECSNEIHEFLEMGAFVGRVPIAGQPFQLG